MNIYSKPICCALVGVLVYQKLQQPKQQKQQRNCSLNRQTNVRMLFHFFMAMETFYDPIFCGIANEYIHNVGAAAASIY